MTIFGWDASDFDWARGPMDLTAAKADGISWFTHKATEATSTKHVHLREALERGRAAGIEFLGAYHVVRSSPSVQAQVGYFLGYLDQQVPWWRTFPGFMLQVDLELWPYDQVSAATGAAFAQTLVAAQPKRVLTYASRGMYGNSLVGVGTPLWNANYGKDNPVAHYPDAYPGDGGAGWVAYSGQAPVMWQYGSRLTIGNQPGCDANAFRGSLAELRQLITGSAGPIEEDDMTPEEHSTLAATDNRVRALVDGLAVMDDTPGYGPGTKVWIVQAVKDIQARLAAPVPVVVDAAAVAAALAKDPTFLAALAKAAFEGAQRAERE